MNEVKHGRKSHNNGIYYSEYPEYQVLTRPQTPWKVSVNVDVKDIKNAYEIVRNYAENNNLSISLATSKVRENYRNGEETVPLIVIKDTERFKPNEMLPELENELINAGVGPGKKEDFKGVPVRGSVYMEAVLPDKQKYFDENELGDDDIKPVMPKNPCATTDVRLSHQDELDLAPVEDNQEKEL